MACTLIYCIFHVVGDFIKWLWIALVEFFSDVSTSSDSSTNFEWSIIVGKNLLEILINRSFWYCYFSQMHRMKALWYFVNFFLYKSKWFLYFDISYLALVTYNSYLNEASKNFGAYLDKFYCFQWYVSSNWQSQHWSVPATIGISFFRKVNPRYFFLLGFGDV